MSDNRIDCPAAPATEAHPNLNGALDDMLQSVTGMQTPGEQPVSWSMNRVICLQPLVLESGHGASVAPSCMVQPAMGDTVLCVSSPEGEPIITAILARQKVEQPLVIESGSPMELRTPAFSLMSYQIDVVAERVDCNVGVIKRIAERIDEAVDYLSSSVGTAFMLAKRSIRRVEELDETRAGHLRLESPTLLEMHGEVTAISGEQLIKMQAQQIHMG